MSTQSTGIVLITDLKPRREYIAALVNTVAIIYQTVLPKFSLERADSSERDPLL